MPKGIRTKELDLREFCVRVRTHLGRDVLINTVRGLQQLLGVASHCQCAENAKKIGSCGGGQPPAAPATGRWETPPDPSSSPRQLQAHDSAARDAQMQPNACTGGVRPYSSNSNVRQHASIEPKSRASWNRSTSFGFGSR